MKKYVLFASCIKEMGGGQMYIRNRCVYLQEKGWIVDVFSAQRGTIIIPELKRFDLFIPELGFDFYLFSRSKAESIISQIVNIIMDKQYDEIVFESSCLSESTWAEVIAERCGAKHFCYILQEYNPISSINDQEFVKFKHDRNELAGIAPSSLYDMFLPFSPIEKDKSLHLPAQCNNVVEDIDCSFINTVNWNEYKYVVGCLSRIDKPFVIPAIQDFINYAKEKSDNFLLLMIGGAPVGTSFEKNIQKMFMSINNVDILITGYLFPVPLKLLRVCDVFFTSAGSSWVCMHSGVPTITYDGLDFRPIGILGKTTNSFLYRLDYEPIQDFSSLMDDILEKRVYQKEDASLSLDKPDFTAHDSFIANLQNDRTYYEFKSIKLTKSEKKLSFFLRILGAERYYHLGVIKKRIFNHKTSDR